VPLAVYVAVARGAGERGLAGALHLDVKPLREAERVLALLGQHGHARARLDYEVHGDSLRDVLKKYKK
jgi:hypothetical protein